MQQLPFVYSNKPIWRLWRHFVFWLLWFLFQLMLYSFSPSPALQRQPFPYRLIITAPETFMYLVPSFFLAYTLMYQVIPKLILPARYGLAMISAITLVFLTAVLSAALSMTVIDHLRHSNADALSPLVASQPHPALYVQFGVAMLAGLRGSITVGGVAAAIKLMKCFYERQQAALILEKEKANAELNMLKAQLHPHFLFNTLNNIYSFTQPVSEKASGMIMGLSQLLRYILYDCSQPLVPLTKEFKMIRDYLSLESTRYDHRLEVSLQLPTTANEVIAPLILLPFIENAFKHGASQMTESPWISIHIELKGKGLRMKLINGKPHWVNAKAPGIGIANVRKRLELLYPDHHQLLISDEDDMYIVDLSLTLIEATPQLIDPAYDRATEEV